MGQETKLPTADEMLKYQLFPSDSARKLMVDKMEEHTRLYTAPLREELEKLRAENERLKNSFDEVFNQRNSIQSKNERLEDENEQFRKLYMDALGHRAKLRGALEYAIKALSVVTSSVIQKSILPELKEALKGATNE